MTTGKIRQCEAVSNQIAVLDKEAFNAKDVQISAFYQAGVGEWDGIF